MASEGGVKSTLNPNAPLFIPAAFRQVEDFSPEWWELVKTSAWFRDYWLNEHPEESFVADEDEEDGGDIVDLISETFELGLNEDPFEELVPDFGDPEKGESGSVDGSEKEKNRPNGIQMDAKAVLRSLKVAVSPSERSPKSPAGSPKYAEKPAKYVSPKCSPRVIHQPR
ncbi:hypothetical protein SLE2022_072570 [Rubroshorea leprosula]